MAQNFKGNKVEKHFWRKVTEFFFHSHAAGAPLSQQPAPCMAQDHPENSRFSCVITASPVERLSHRALVLAAGILGFLGQIREFCYGKAAFPSKVDLQPKNKTTRRKKKSLRNPVFRLVLSPCFQIWDFLLSSRESPSLHRAWPITWQPVAKSNSVKWKLIGCNFGP